MVVAVMLAVGGCSARPAVPGSGVRAETSGPTAPSATADPTQTLAVAIRQWEAVAGDHFDQSARALEAVSAAAGTGDDAAVRDGCTLLHDTNAVGLQGHLPTPDPALTAELQHMIDDMNTATHACLRFVERRDGADAAVYQDYLGRAVEHLGRAKVILDADLAGR